MPVCVWFHIMYAFKITSGKSAPSSVQRQEVLAGLFLRTQWPFLEQLCYHYRLLFIAEYFVFLYIFIMYSVCFFNTLTLTAMLNKNDTDTN